ncbi:MAG TPA: hypothetical protein VJ600_00180, partial [Holophagaceae bacterium]|nr:hypothetical protein [Holophagaceae bacterium]
ALVDEVAGLPKLDVAPLSPGEVARLSRLNFATMPCQGVVQPRVSFLQQRQETTWATTLMLVVTALASFWSTRHWRCCRKAESAVRARLGI